MLGSNLFNFNGEKGKDFRILRYDVEFSVGHQETSSDMSVALAFAMSRP